MFTVYVSGTTVRLPEAQASRPRSLASFLRRPPASGTTGTPRGESLPDPRLSLAP
jgi:hypothetical protein